jgi:hypothetical protein
VGMMKSSGASDIVDIDLDVITETEKAYRVSNSERRFWLPKSQVEYDGARTFSMPEWLAHEKELI